MTRFWFVSAPLLSHTDWGGLLPTAVALRARGHDVLWVSEAAIGGYVSGAGLPFAPVTRTGWLWPPPPVPDLTTLAPQEAVLLRYRRALDTWLSVPLVEEGTRALLALACERRAPDVLVTDPFLTASALVAEALTVPLAVGGWPAMDALDEEFLYPVQRDLGRDSQDRLEGMLERFGLRGDNFSGGPTPSLLSPHLHVSYFSESWYQAEIDTLLDQTLFVGGAPGHPKAPPPAWLAEIPAETPLALITLGSIFTGDLGFFAWAARAAARAGLLPVVVVGWNPIDEKDKATLKAALPPGTRLLNWVPFDHVLARARLIIHHGGMGTTHAAIVHGVPQVIVPHAADQRGQARRAAQAKVGLNLTALDVRQGALAQAARALVNDDRVRENAAVLAREFAALGGPERAADALEQVAGTG